MQMIKVPKNSVDAQNTTFPSYIPYQQEIHTRNKDFISRSIQLI